MKSANVQYSEVAGYRLTRHIGSGGMGDVYKAFHTTLNREAAVKILYQKELADRFENEAYIQSSVNHPNIARLYEYVSSSEIHCIVMEYVEGESLDSYIHKKGKLTSEETEKILVQIISALAYLHQKEVVHRDIKPQNFKIQADGTVKMLDFGIAKHKYSPKLTQQGFVVGTTEYMAPEQFDEQADKRSDIWSLGVMVYEMLTGYLPFEATNPITLRSKISKGSFTDPKILVPLISEKLTTVIDKSLRINPAARISAGEMENLLTGKKKSKIQKHKPDHTHNRFKLPQIKLTSLRKKLIAGALIVLLIITGISLLKRPGEKLPDIHDIPEKKEQPGNTQKIMINVPGVENGVLIFPDGQQKSTPYAIEGNNGDRVKFTIHAEGYMDKKVEIEITHRRSSYAYTLEKINY
jgi:serine/threonine-protein kinase